MFYLFLGILIGFIVSFVVLKRSINQTGYGELKLCRDRCPYYSANKVVDSDDE